MGVKNFLAHRLQWYALSGRRSVTHQPSYAQPHCSHAQEPTNLLFKTLDVFAPDDFMLTSAFKQVTEIDAVMLPPQWKRFLSLVPPISSLSS
jgi:hypothetical protein